MAIEESSITSLDDVNSRKDFEQYLFSGGESEMKLADKIGIDRSFLRRITGRTQYVWKNAVQPSSAECLCKYIALRENKSADEILRILKDKDIIFETTVFSSSFQETCTIKEDLEEEHETCTIKEDLEEEQDVITKVKAVVNNVMQRMHYGVDDNFKICEGTPLSGYVRVTREFFVPFVNTRKWEYVYTIYIPSNISDDELDNKVENIKAMHIKEEMLIFIVCEGSDILKKVRNINTFGIKNSIIVANQQEYDDLYIISMCTKHKKIFELEKEWAEDIHLLS